MGNSNVCCSGVRECLGEDYKEMNKSASESKRKSLKWDMNDSPQKVRLG